MSDHAKERLDKEFKLLRNICLCNQDMAYSESMSTVIEYYSKLKCKAEKGYTCQYPGYCVYCSNLAFSEDIVRCIDNFSTANFKHMKTISLQIIGPSGSIYDGRYYQLLINIPVNYPSEPPTAYFGTQVYHINVDQDTNQIMFKNINKLNWKNSVRLFQFLVEIFLVLVEPDDSKNHFLENA